MRRYWHWQPPYAPHFGEATQCQATSWRPMVSTTAIWREPTMCWNDTHLRLPNVVAHDTGKAFMVRAIRHTSTAIDVRFTAVSAKSPQSISTVERYHAPVRRACNVIISEFPTLDGDSALQMAITAVNDSFGPSWLVPTLLVHSALPRLGFLTDPSSPSQ